MKSTFTVIYTNKKPLLNDYCSIEFGIHDGKNHFDHHGIFINNKAPCNNLEIKPRNNIKIYLNHLDTDNLIGLMRMIGHKLPSINYELIEKIDLNGTYILSNQEKQSETNLYHFGIKRIVRKSGLIRVTDNEIDITDMVKKILKIPEKEIVKRGNIEIKKMNSDFDKCIVKKEKGIILLKKDDTKAFNSSLAYDLGFKIVVVYDETNKSISVSSRPDIECILADKFINGIYFQGHPKSCGSPRDKSYGIKDALKVFNELVKN